MNSLSISKSLTSWKLISKGINANSSWWWYSSSRNYCAFTVNYCRWAESIPVWQPEESFCGKKLFIPSIFIYHDYGDFDDDEQDLCMYVSFQWSSWWCPVGCWPCAHSDPSHDDDDDDHPAYRYHCHHHHNNQVRPDAGPAPIQIPLNPEKLVLPQPGMLLSWQFF